jgi:hypothetical protein
MASQFSRYLLYKANITDSDKMRGQSSLNSSKTTRSAHFWPHFREENCDALSPTSGAALRSKAEVEIILKRWVIILNSAVKEDDSLYALD